MNVKWIVFACCLPLTLWAQGFAGLGTQAEGFDTPTRGTKFEFPRDHGAHPSYRIEWWYVTANFQTEDGKDMGLQWTLFRSALAPYATNDWQSPQVWMGHAALTTKDQHVSAERFARGGIGQAGVETEPEFEAWIDDWSMIGSQDLSQLNMSATGTDFSYDITLKSESKLVFHDDAGYSVKSAQGQSSYYYSQPFYQLNGTVSLNGETHSVIGSAWLDREWSSQPLSDDQNGWDWFSLSFDDGAKMMGFVLRQTDGMDFKSGTWITADGRTFPMQPDEIEFHKRATSKTSGATVPTQWTIKVPDRGVDIDVTALNPDSWMNLTIPYWEGPVFFDGSHKGNGYLEMTGYDP